MKKRIRIKKSKKSGAWIVRRGWFGYPVASYSGDWKFCSADEIIEDFKRRYGYN